MCVCLLPCTVSPSALKHSFGTQWSGSTVGNRVTMSFSIEYRPTVTGCHLKNPVQLKYFETVDGAVFVKVCKSDSVMCRLLVEDGAQMAGRPLSMTDILEQLSTLRNKVYHELAFAPDKVEDDKEDLGLDAPTRRRAKDLSELPKIIVVEAPCVDDVPGKEMRLLLDKPGKPLWMELNEGNLKYLKDSVGCQINSGQIKRSHPRATIEEESRVECDVKGLCYSYKRKSVRATGQVDGKPVTKYFKVKDTDTIESAMNEARAWLTENSSGASASGSAP